MSKKIITILLIFVFCSSFFSFKHGSEPPYKYGKPNKAYIQKKDQMRFDSLFEIYGKNKIFPKGYKLQALVALSHYPELKETHIEFRFKKAKIAHTSRPSFCSTIKQKENRKYQITISNDISDELELTKLKNLTYNAQIGVLGHELGHVSDYVNQNFCKLISYGAKYTNEKGIIKIENRTDRITINHGLGYQLLEWSKEVHNLHIRDGRGKRYLSPEEILQEIKTNNIYKNI